MHRRKVGVPGRETSEDTIMAVQGMDYAGWIWMTAVEMERGGQTQRTSLNWSYGLGVLDKV